MKNWTIGPHQRKFLISPGSYLLGGELLEDELVFWGEWEAQSEVDPISAPMPDGPRWLHRPFFDPPASYHGLANTDPFVFGDQFHYTGCRQHIEQGPTQLQNLSRGSVILFGSCRGRSFVVDTVFVVADFVDHSRRDFRDTLRGHISDEYERVTITPWYANTPQRDRIHRLYFGATPTAPVDGMFSFVPCLPASKAPYGFPRPEIFFPDIITRSLTQNYKLTCVDTTSELKGWWNDVARQVTAQG